MFPDAPVNGTDNFFEELYDYRNASLEDSFDTMDVHQVAGQVRHLVLQASLPLRHRLPHTVGTARSDIQYPAIAAQLYAALRKHVEAA